MSAILGPDAGAYRPASRHAACLSPGDSLSEAVSAKAGRMAFAPLLLALCILGGMLYVHWNVRHARCFLPCYRLP